MHSGKTARGLAFALIAGFALLAGMAALIHAPLARAAGHTTHPGRRDVRITIERANARMGTVCTITAEGHDSTWTSTAVDDAFGEIARLDSVLSSWRTDSELAHVNAAGAERRIPCSPDFFAVLDSSLAIARETDGAFDPTVEALERAWNLRGAGRVPEPGQLAEALQRVGWVMIETAPGARTVRFRRDGMGLDFGGIGKGYALDRAISLLRERQVRRALLSFGGELAGFSDGQAWLIDIPDPADRLRAALRLVMRRGAVATSGQGESFVTVEHQRFGHILDPRSGRPLDTQATVTVVAGSATRADGISTALLVMGRERARAFIEARPDLGAVWLERDAGKIRAWRWNLPTVSIEPGVEVEWVQ